MSPTEATHIRAFPFSFEDFAKRYLVAPHIANGRIPFKPRSDEFLQPPMLRSFLLPSVDERSLCVRRQPCAFGPWTIVCAPIVHKPAVSLLCNISRDKQRTLAYQANPSWSRFISLARGPVRHSV